MSINQHQLVRQLLLEHPDGMTVTQVHEAMGFKYRCNTATMLKNIYDIYIDRWILMGHTWTPIYICAPVPESCPRPGGSSARIASLTPAQLRRAKKMQQEGFSKSAIAQRLNVNRSTISNALLGIGIYGTKEYA